jgi:hypothetical protein
MAYIGQSIKNGTFTVLDTSGNTYNGSNTTFNLGTQVGSPAQLLVSHDGVIQKAGTDYLLATGGTQITFTTAPASGASIFIVEISGAVGGPMNRDINGDELILDVDGDTSITADTDDQIDVKIGGTDQFSIKDGVIEPTTDNDVDIGSSSKEFKDGYFDGTLFCDTLNLAGTAHTSISSGITEADQWRMTSNQTSTGLITNLERVDTTGGGYIGTGMSQSSGTFTFPSTGYYLISFFMLSDGLTRTQILTTTDNSSYAIATRAYADNSVQSGVSQFLFDVTNTSTHKVQFNVDAVSTLYGSTSQNLTHMTFIRLGDT